MKVSFVNFYFFFVFLRYFCKDMQISLDKKSNIEYLEKEFGLHKFLPKSVLEGIKPKVLKKAIQQQFKKVVVKFEILSLCAAVVCVYISS